VLVMNVAIVHAVGRLHPANLMRNRLCGQWICVLRKTLTLQHLIGRWALASVSELLEEDPRPVNELDIF
jgi:hypothetical protein